MNEVMQFLTLQTGLEASSLLVIGIGIGAMLVVLGVASSLSSRDPALVRMGQGGQRRRATAADHGILRDAMMTPKGLMKAFIPTDGKQLSDVQRQLASAGMTAKYSVRNYYLLRATLGFLLPGVMLGLIWAARTGAVPLPDAIDARLAGWETMRVLQVLTLSTAIGFFGPALWLRSRASERQRRIEEHFPNALDLIQISVEAGLGFDAAMIRVGNELEFTAPDISQEFLGAQRQIQAGRTRDRALMDMAARTGVEEVASFANVVLQSMQFGTSVSETLTTYAQEMRLHRELKAQEKANRLPVQMSAVLASLMLPALLLLTLGPVIIRYVRFFSG